MRNLLVIGKLGQRHHLTGPILCLAMLGACGGNTDGGGGPATPETVTQQCGLACQKLAMCEAGTDITECQTDCAGEPAAACLGPFQALVVCVRNALESSADCDTERVVQERCGAEMGQYEICEESQEPLEPEPVEPVPVPAPAPAPPTTCSVSSGASSDGTECFFTRQCGSETWNLFCTADANGGSGQCECSYASPNGSSGSKFIVPSWTPSMCDDGYSPCEL